MFLLLAAVAIALAGRAGERPFHDGAWLLVLGGLVIVPALGKSGAWTNYLLPLYCALVVLACRLWPVTPPLAVLVPAALSLALLARPFPLPSPADVEEQDDGDPAPKVLRESERVLRRGDEGTSIRERLHRGKLHAMTLDAGPAKEIDGQAPRPQPTSSTTGRVGAAATRRATTRLRAIVQKWPSTPSGYARSYCSPRKAVRPRSSVSASG